MAVYLTAAVCYGVLCGVCRPFKKWHMAMLAVIPAVFCGACMLFSGLFYIEMLSWQEWLFTAIVIPSAVIFLWRISRLLGKILDRWQWGFPSATKVKKAFTAAVLTVSVVYAAWLSVVFTDYISLEHGGEPIFAAVQPDGSYSGLMYYVEDKEVYIFAQNAEDGQ